MKQGMFLLDLDRCTGCAACVVACNNENEVAVEIPWRRVHSFNSPRYPSAPVFHYSLACSHCVEPSCLHNCPANAYTKDPRLERSCSTERGVSVAVTAHGSAPTTLRSTTIRPESWRNALSATIGWPTDWNRHASARVPSPP